VTELQVERDDGVLRLVIDRPDRRNALSPGVLDAMTAALHDLGGARVVLVASTGDRVFSSGADLVAMAPGATGLELHESRGGLRELVLAMRGCPVPVVARVQGLCLAGAVGLMLGCDLVVASRDARFGLPEVDLGLWPFMVSALLGRHVSPKVAMDLMLSGERIDAERAASVGLVSRVVDRDQLDAEVGRLLTALAAKPPVAVRLGKAAFAAALESSLAAGLEAMQAQLSLLAQSADAAEGVSAFLAKRDPSWTGR
jgi:enoyl-CoA hydratase